MAIACHHIPIICPDLPDLPKGDGVIHVDQEQPHSFPSIADDHILGLDVAMGYSECPEGQLDEVGLREETICQLWYIHLATHEFVQHDACLHHDRPLLETVPQDVDPDTDLLHDQVFLDGLGGQVSLHDVDLSLVVDHANLVIECLVLLVIILDGFPARLFEEKTILG